MHYSEAFPIQHSTKFSLKAFIMSNVTYIFISGKIKNKLQPCPVTLNSYQLNSAKKEKVIKVVCATIKIKMADAFLLETILFLLI